MSELGNPKSVAVDYSGTECEIEEFTLEDKPGFVERVGKTSFCITRDLTQDTEGFLKALEDGELDDWMDYFDDAPFDSFNSAVTWYLGKFRPGTEGSDYDYAEKQEDSDLSDDVEWEIGGETDYDVSANEISIEFEKGTLTICPSNIDQYEVTDASGKTTTITKDQMIKMVSDAVLGTS